MRQRNIFWFWFPLFASWLLMAAEGPIISTVINRLPNEVVMLAAYGIMLSLSVTIESPIINLLATSTALAKDRHSYLLIRRFTIHWISALTVVAFLIAYTPLFEVIVPGWMGVPAGVAAWVRPGMQIMVLWSAAIGWRRFLQGVLIRFNQARKIAWGTAVRLLASGGAALALGASTQFPGIVIGGLALMAGVLAEAIYATIAARSVLKNELGAERPAAPGEALTYRKLFWFHLPLAGTSFLLLLVQPMVAFSLSQLDDPTQTLAAWPLVFQVMLVARAAAFALPEVVIALTKGPDTLAPVRRFAITLAVANTVLLGLFIFTPLIDVYLFGLQDATAAIGATARQGLAYFLLLPALTVFLSWLRGLLIHTGATKTVNLGMAVNLAVTSALLLAGVLLQLPGIATAALAMNGAYLVELGILWWGVQTSMRQIARRSIEQSVPAEA